MTSSLSVILVAVIFAVTAVAAFAAITAGHAVARVVRRRGRHHKPLSPADTAALAWVRSLQPTPGALAAKLRATQAALAHFLEQAARAKVAPDPNADLVSRWAAPAGTLTTAEEGAKLWHASSPTSPTRADPGAPSIRGMSGSTAKPAS